MAEVFYFTSSPKRRHSREGGNPALLQIQNFKESWAPAFAEVTDVWEARV